MDMKISGSGQIASGEYDEIKISGSARLSGLVRCATFRVSGSAKGDALDCKNELKISGSSRFTQSVKAGSGSVSGSFGCEGDFTAREQVKCAGSLHCGGSLRCGALSASGKITVGGDTEAEKVDVSGKLYCGGLLNAEEISIECSSGMEIGSIGGCKIVIYREERGRSVSRLPLFSSFVKKAGGAVLVKQAIEGDHIAIENVVVPRVSGRVVAIGEDCEIDLVQYNEEIEISPKAKVGKVEKIEAASEL